MARFDLSDAEWRVIAPLLRNKSRGVPRTDDRRVLNAFFYVLRTGSPWRDLPERYGPYTTAYNRYNRWAKAGSGYSRLCRGLPTIDGLDRQLDHQGPPACGWWKKGGPDHAIGRSRGGLSTKINVIVDGEGLPIRLALTPGQASDKEAAVPMIASLNRTRDLVADRGYDAQYLLDLARTRGTTTHIPP